jgi:hypothetical protein
MIGITIKLLSSRWTHYIILISAVLWFRNDAAKWHYAHGAAVSAGLAGVEAQKAANLAAEAAYRSKADESDRDYQTALSDAQRRTERFIAGRVRSPVACDSGGTIAAPKDSRASVPEITTADPIMVTIESGNVRTCTADYEYALAAHLWANGLGD